MSDKFLAVELWNQKYTRGLQDHSPPNQGLNLPSIVEAQSLNCWTAREVSHLFLLLVEIACTFSMELVPIYIL